MFEDADIGRIGTDDVGNRFVVLRPGGVAGTTGADRPNYVAILPGNKSPFARSPGTVLHASWLEMPLSWEE